MKYLAEIQENLMQHDPKPWKRLATAIILDRKHLRVQEDRVELPDGRKTIYIRHAPADFHSVAIIAVNGKGEMLIEREYSYPPNKVMWQLPGGSMKPGETPQQAALRELAEECGYGARRTSLIGAFYVNNRLSDKKQHVVLCTGLFDHKLPEDDDEFITFQWLSKRILKTMIANGDFDNINLLAGLNLWFNLTKHKE